MKNGLGFVIVVVVLSCWVRFAGGATLVVPDQIASVSEAVNLAASGDTILVKEHDTLVDGTLVIKDKDLLITGSSNEDRAMIGFENSTPPPVSYDGFRPTIQIENARVTLRYIEGLWARVYYVIGSTTFHTAGPIEVLSGALTVQDCVVYCSISSSGSLHIERSHIFGQSWASAQSPPYPIGSTGVPAVRIHDADGIEVSVSDTAIQSDHAVGLALQNLTNAFVRLDNSRVVGGTAAARRYYGGLGGFSGMYIADCLDLRLVMPNSLAQGADGDYGGYVKGYWGSGGSGGHGLHAMSSTIQLTNGRFLGGTGANARLSFDSTFGYGPPDLFSGGSGGHGLALQNSHARASGLEFMPGEAGAPDVQEASQITYTAPAGEPGLPIYMDVLSTYQELSCVPGWADYSQ